ncbi:MAG: zinc-dependent metalloprotease [Xanthomonadales bacterium]|nr:zinc-dependent metalloprotease [Xanthomonadales bacterium]
METNYSWLTAILLSLFIVGTIWAADDAADIADKEKEEEKPKTIAEFTKDADRIDGLFTLFRDKKTGETSMLIKPDQLDKEYIYWMQVANGVVDAGFFKGAYGPSSIIELHRNFNKVEFIEKNTAFYFDPNNAISRAASANISDALLAVEAIAAKDEASGDILIKVDKVFGTEALAQIKPSPDPDADPKTTFTLGELNGDKTRILNLRSYPANTDIEVEYVYNNPAPTVPGKAAITDSRNVSLRVMHSLIEVPGNDYQPRRDDPRIGYFGEQITDLTSNKAAPYRDLISRWNLVKKEPGAAMSEPVEPITWWIENTTPVEWRDLIRDAALEWNKSFEKIGFKDAIVVKVQPDDADWDAGDIRYNVLRWTSSPNPPFGGYGPSFTNPRTGQIIGADVMLEYSFMHRLPRMRNLIQDPAASMATLNPNFGARYCVLGQGLAMNNTFASAAAAVYGFTDELDQQLTRDTMHYLILHEMGHTLGMNHNMKATQFLSPDEAWDKSAVKDGILAGSVMDYPAVNFAPTRDQQTLFYTISPGPYDDWFIEYGYSEGLADPLAEQQRLDAILVRSTDPRLAFGNDADDMRAPGAGIDPRVNIYDMSTDAVTYASRQMDIMQVTLNGLPGKLPPAGDSYQEIVAAVSAIMDLWGRSAAVTSRYVGGIYVDRAMVGQAGGGQPYTPVEEARQRQAMEVLATQVFAPDAFQLSPELLRIAAPQRRGFDHFGSTEDPKIHDAVLGVQKGVLDQLLNPVLLKRVSDSALYGNTYSLGEVFNDLTDAVFAADAKGNVNSYRRNLQTDYVMRLATMVKGEGYDTAAISMSVYSLNRIEDLLGDKRNANVETQAHVQNLELIIERALSDNV